MVRKVGIVVVLAIGFVVALGLPAFAQATGGGDQFGQLTQVVAFVGFVAVVFGPGSVGIAMLVDAAKRRLDPNDAWKSDVWIAAAFVIAVASCVGFKIDVTAQLLAKLPVAAGRTLPAIAGQLLTAVGMAGMASWHHDHMALKRAKTANLGK
jgi:hypothetical protein